MPTAPLPSSSQATAATRDRGDACPGTLRLHEAHDGALARVRVPGGVLTARQAEALAVAAGRLGDGELHLTSRGNVQLRGLGGTCGGELADLLGAAGLLPSPAHDRVRNVVASPLSGLDGLGLRDVRPWLVSLDAALCAGEAVRALSGRFLFALDDGRGDVAGLGADVTLRAVADGGALLGLGGGGEALHVSGADAPRAALVAAETFLAAVRTSGTAVWRVAELPLAEGVLLRQVADRLAAAGIDCARRSPVPDQAGDGPDHAGDGPDHAGDGPDHAGDGPDHAGDGPDHAGDGPAPGIVGDRAALSVHAPLGRLSALQWRALTRLAARFPAGEVRLTPWRGVVVPTPGLGPAAGTEALGRLSAVGLVTDPASPWLRVGACVGRPGCAKSLADVRRDAARGLAAATGSELPLYWSGCERRCGRPRGDHIDVVAVADGAYRLAATAHGRPPRTASLDDPTRLAAALAAIAPRP